MIENTAADRPPPRSILIVCFLAVYIIWGSTYLAIRVAVDTLPPFLMAGVRFLFAGLSLFLLSWFRGTPMPRRLEWRNAVIAGCLLLVGGNGGVVWAEQTVPSGLTALIIATIPAWFALLEWIRPGGTRPRLQTVIGIGVGFAGVILLIDPARTSSGSGISFRVVAVIVATASWAAGSLYSKYSVKPQSPWVNVAIQMIGGGAGLTLLGVCHNEPSQVHWNRFSANSLWAFAYLIVFGSWIAFSAYVWLLKHTTPAQLSTYAYVNPVIAVFLGWLILHEPVNRRTLLAAVVILTGVVIITLPAGLISVRPRQPTVIAKSDTE